MTMNDPTSQPDDRPARQSAPQPPTDHTPNPNDPVSREASRAIAHLNADHADALLDMARALAGCPEATSARCLDADQTALTLEATTPTDTLTLRIPYDEPIPDATALRKATVKLAHRAREAMDRS
jgi:heme iron utilization protein